jgi:predicted amino acid-binding ACT domain protein
MTLRPAHSSRVIVSVIGKDRGGIVGAVSTVRAEAGANIRGISR